MSKMEVTLSEGNQAIAVVAAVALIVGGIALYSWDSDKHAEKDKAIADLQQSVNRAIKFDEKVVAQNLTLQNDKKELTNKLQDGKFIIEKLSNQITVMVKDLEDRAKNNVEDSKKIADLQKQVQFFKDYIAALRDPVYNTPKTIIKKVIVPTSPKIVYKIVNKYINVNPKVPQKVNREKMTVLKWWQIHHPAKK